MSEIDQSILIDLLFNTKMTNKEIADSLNCSVKKVTHLIKELNLGWVRRKRGELSYGQAALTDIMRTLLPGVEVITEKHIGERLKLDVFCPRYKLAAEFHGKQHFEFTPFFHNTYDDFTQSKIRDQRKSEICQELGIVLVVFRYDENLSEDIVCNRLISAIKSFTQPKPETKESIRGNPYYEAMKEKRKQYQKELYQKTKDRKKPPR